jgi:hypothetical protein
MKLVIVDRSRSATYERMRYLFAADPNVAVIWDRRTAEERRREAEQRAPNRRVRERRHKAIEFGQRGFIVIDLDAAETPAGVRTPGV